MKLVTFTEQGGYGAGFVDGSDVVVCESGPPAANAVRRIVEANGAGLDAWAAKVDDAASRRPLGEVDLAAPMPELRRQAFCVGKNYRAHATEFHVSGFDSGGEEEVPAAPVIFTKAAALAVGAGGDIRASLDPTGTVDYEGELGVVIGRRAFQVSRSGAFDVVFGYVIVNDVTSRELQRRHSQWVIGKSIDTFCPMGPYIVTADEVADVEALELETRVNGELRQKARLSDLIFDIPALIETITATMTLLPGDVIATGTPAGVGIGFTPPRYLVPGDRVRVCITGLGELENRVV